MGKFVDLTGQKFSRLTVIKRVANSDAKQTRWLCKCQCGNMKVVQGAHLKDKHTRSCGCMISDSTIARNIKNIIHGHSANHQRSKTYRTWDGMKDRCMNPYHKQYKDYGGRGIQVCKRWLKFENFLQDMGEKPEGLTLDRIDNDGDYCPENCQWSTWLEQQRNRNNNRLITINGVTKCLSEWCEFYHMDYYKIYQRIQRGWSIERALEID